MGACFSTITRNHEKGSAAEQVPSLYEVNRLLDKWTMGHVSVCIFAKVGANF